MIRRARIGASAGLLNRSSRRHARVDVEQEHTDRADLARRCGDESGCLGTDPISRTIGRNFVRAVARGRNVNESTVTTLYGKGRVLFAPAALRFGMIDDIQTLATALSFPPGAKRRGAAANAPSRAVSHNARRRRLRLLELS